MILGILLAACTIPVSTSLRSEVGMGMDLDQSCEGTGTRDDDGNISTFTLTLEGDVCRVDVTWTGTLASQEDLDAELDRALDGRPVDRENITVTAATLTLDRIAVVDDAGAPVSLPTIPEWAMDLEVGGDTLYSATGVDLQVLLPAPVTLPLGTGQIAVINAAVQGTGSLDGTGAAMLRLPVSSLPATSTPMTIELEGDMALDAEVGL